MKKKRARFNLGKNKKVRSIESGPKPLWLHLESELVSWVSYERNERKSIITYNSIQDKAIELAANLNCENFIAADGWISNF
jgi:hypothetical protein